MSSGLRTLIWNSMLEADLNYRYYTVLATRYRTYDLGAKIFIAITTSAAVSGWAIWGQYGLDWLWKTASGVATIIAIALPIVNPANIMKVAGEEGYGWFSILEDYKLLWATVDEEEDEENIRKECKRIQLEEKRLVGASSGVRKRRRLARRCETEMRTYWAANTRGVEDVR